MGARIGFARLKSNPAKMITAAEYNPDKHRGDVLCPDGRCKCEIQGVQASTRNINGDQVNVDAFFRLPGGAEKSGRGHATACRFNIEKTVKRLVAMSQEIKNLDNGAELLLDAARKSAEFRLHILMELLPSIKQGWRTAAADALAGGHMRVGNDYVRSSRLLKPYLRVAKAVLSLISRVQEHPELAACIKLKYGARNIAWENYFFDRDKYAELYQYLLSQQQFRRTRGQSRPVALAVEIAGDRLTQTRFGHWQIRARASRCIIEGEAPFAIRPVLYIADEAVAHRIARERNILVCGVPTLGSFRDPEKKGLVRCADVSIDIISRTQVCRYHPTLSESHS